jgi:putative acetyltransferase
VIKIRPEKPEDITAIRVVNESAFGQREEADIVDRLGESCAEFISLVAEDETIVGAILFTPAAIETPGEPVVWMGLAPLAVLPKCQRQGIGSALVRRGLEIVRERGCPFVVVLGHPEYYPRFGFERASAHGLARQRAGVPDEAFMVIIMDEQATEGASGVARYRDEFGEAV